MLLVPKPNQIISTALSQHRIEKKLNLKICKVATQRNVKFQFICGLQNRTLPTFILPIGSGLRRISGVFPGLPIRLTMDECSITTDFPFGLSAIELHCGKCRQQILTRKKNFIYIYKT